MTRGHLIILLSVFLLFSCSRKDDRPAQANDSLLTKPMVVTTPVATPPTPADSGLYIDRSRLRTPAHEKLLQRFTPSQVVEIYHNFKPLRKEGTSEEQIDAYLKEKKITVEELKAVLEEGDALGWVAAK
jgi:hypothetical protein